jgi:hypothetical protein
MMVKAMGQSENRHGEGGCPNTVGVLIGYYVASFGAVVFGTALGLLFGITIGGPSGLWPGSVSGAAIGLAMTLPRGPLIGRCVGALTVVCGIIWGAVLGNDVGSLIGGLGSGAATGLSGIGAWELLSCSKRDRVTSMFLWIIIGGISSGIGLAVAVAMRSAEL